MQFTSFFTSHMHVKLHMHAKLSEVYDETHDPAID